MKKRWGNRGCFWLLMLLVFAAAAAGYIAAAAAVYIAAAAYIAVAAAAYIAVALTAAKGKGEREVWGVYMKREREFFK